MRLLVRARVVDVSKQYGSTRALDSVSFELRAGVTVLLGRNGAGKSTVSRILVGAERPTSGSVVVSAEGDETPFTPRAQLRQSGWLPQAFTAPGSMTVRQLVEYAAWLKEVPGFAAREAVSDAIYATDLERLADRRVATLSGGMLQRLGIAQAVVHAPGLLVLDEPTAGLDPEQRAGFHELVRNFAEDRSVLVSTHLLEDAVALAAHAVVLDAGRVQFDGTVSELEALGEGGGRAERLRTAFLNVIERRPT